MSKNKSFQHKVVYGVCIIVILIAVSLISRPATSNQPGGMLAQMRREYRISDAQLGKVDPASEAMRLSLLGLDGVAITFLWSNLNEYQKTEQYTLMEATAKTISYLNPHLLKVWEFQAWNLSYNVSREFDNYKHRYLWVKRGINYHMDGTEYNYNEPRMMNSIGHFFGNKFGNADEKKEYREIFPDDDIFHEEIQKHLEGTKYSVVEGAEGVQEGKPDNWLVARLWDQWATEVVDNGLGSIGAMSPTIFYQYPAKRLMNFGEAAEKEGNISEKAQAAWAQAYDEWREYGDHELPSTYGIPIKLNDADRLKVEIEEVGKKFDDAYGQYKEKVYAEKFAKLPEETRKAIETPKAERTEEQMSLARMAEPSVNVSRFEVVAYMRDNNIDGVLEASKLANVLDETEFMRGVINRQKDIVAFNYWLTRAKSERTDRTVEARKLVYDAHEAYKAADLVKARELYEQAWELWTGIYEDFPELREDASSDVLADSIKEYRELLNHFDQDISPNFPLIDILRAEAGGDFQEPEWVPEDAPKSDEKAEAEAGEMKSEEAPKEEPADKPMESKPAEESEKPAAEPMKEEASAESKPAEPAQESAESSDEKSADPE
ncbi:hypothetical protein AB1L30_08915 [Bremerella sp. JC817]|uniref:hypothetical protein n=1 Tax=Bremerella sp. JC817 TaxID=3231756 RepID=UPI0034581F34